MTVEVIIQYEPPVDGFHTFPLEQAQIIPDWLEEHGLEMADATIHLGEAPIILVAYWREEQCSPPLRLVTGVG